MSCEQLAEVSSSWYMDADEIIKTEKGPNESVDSNERQDDTCCLDNRRGDTTQTKKPLRVEDTAIKLYTPIILDVQLLQTNVGYLVKELAYKTPPCHLFATDSPLWTKPDNSLHYVCYKHDEANVPAYRTIEVDGKIHDRFTGLAIGCGDVAYSDEHVLSSLQDYDLIFLKGHNKKRVLGELFKRHANYESPEIVNVDSSTMDEHDLEFCRRHLMAGAKFSFKFVYRRLPSYLKLVCDRKGNTGTDLPIYLSNVVVEDRRHKVFARGRPLWICPYDHTCGERHFSSQRCAALNLGLLETLWYLMRDNEYRDLLKSDARENGFQDGSKIRYKCDERAECGNKHRYHRHRVTCDVCTEGLQRNNIKRHASIYRIRNTGPSVNPLYQ